MASAKRPSVTRPGPMNRNWSQDVLLDLVPLRPPVLTTAARVPRLAGPAGPRRRLVHGPVDELAGGQPAPGRDRRRRRRLGPPAALPTPRRPLPCCGPDGGADAARRGRRIDRAAFPGDEPLRGQRPVAVPVREGRRIGRLAPERQAGRRLLEDVAAVAVVVLALDGLAHDRAEGGLQRGEPVAELRLRAGAAVRRALGQRRWRRLSHHDA